MGTADVVAFPLRVATDPVLVSVSVPLEGYGGELVNAEGLLLAAEVRGGIDEVDTMPVLHGDEEVKVLFP